MWTGVLNNNNNNITKEPAILEHFELMQHSLDFLESLKTISKPIVEVSLLPNIRFKGWCLVCGLCLFSANLRVFGHAIDNLVFA